MSETHLVSVPERGHTDIDVPTWDELANEAAFWSLVDQGILTVSRPSTIKVRLHGGCYDLPPRVVPPFKLELESFEVQPIPATS